ncbi:MAG TPA: hypothetical protein VIU38_07730 [Anaerolineales bacterium]
MSGRTLLYLGAVVLFIVGMVLLFFAFVFLTAAPSAGGSSGTAGILGVAGLILLAGGAGLVYAAIRGQKTEVIQQVTMRVDLPGETKISPVTCRNCGGTLKPENIKMVGGAPMVVCPYCGTTYQLTEAPKW